jgi:glycosyltransferase involved in cell wall biosynthesis
MDLPPGGCFRNRQFTMKVLFNCEVPFSLTHGGMQIQIEQSNKALQQIGVETEFLQWWDEKQNGDILHQFGAVPDHLTQFARAKGYKVIVTILLSHQCNRSPRELFVRQMAVASLLSLPLPPRMKAKLPWQAARHYDHLIVGLEAERHVLEQVYGVPREKISIVPLGLPDTFLKAGPALRTENHLVCTGTINPIKKSLELAQIAHQANVPMLFVGKPYDFEGQYWKDFQKLVDGKLIKLHPHVEDQAEMAQLLRQARGYVLMSRFENWSLTTHEAAACGLPLLLPDKNWSRERFGNQAHYFPKKWNSAAAAAALSTFYEKCPSLPSPQVHLPTWIEAAEKLREIYHRVLKGSAAK